MREQGVTKCHLSANSAVSFAEFEKCIVSPDLKAVAAHWNDARGAKPMPSWSDIRPSALAKQLSIVWSFVYDAQADELIGRLGGERISQIFGKSIKGEKLSQLAPIIARERLIARIKRVISEPALVWGDGPMFKQLEKYGIGERIIMPLGANGVTGDAVLGATIYRLEYIPGRTVQIAEQENWFALEI